MGSWLSAKGATASGGIVICWGPHSGLIGRGDASAGSWLSDVWDPHPVSMASHGISDLGGVVGRGVVCCCSWLICTVSGGEKTGSCSRFTASVAAEGMEVGGVDGVGVPCPRSVCSVGGGGVGVPCPRSVASFGNRATSLPWDIVVVGAL